jgi:glyoxylase-like metal-dependent hydrolase (beta-lactamase superfamily II)
MQSVTTGYKITASIARESGARHSAVMSLTKSLRAAVVPVTQYRQNCALLWDEASGAGVVVDPGGDVPRILDAVAQSGMRPERILLTHGHFDHAGGAAAVREALGVPVEGPDRRDAFLLDSLATDGPARGLPDARTVTPDRWLAEGDEVAFGPHRMRVLHTPGHTPGHIAFIHDEERFALVGDVLFRGGIGRTDIPRGDLKTLLASIRDKLMPLDDEVSFLCGHGPGSTIGRERRANPFVRQALSA